jgi:hypothetical protein
LFLWVRVLEKIRFRLVVIGLAAVALEGFLCVLFSDVRFLPVSGLRVNQLTAGNWFYLAAYLTLVLIILVGSCVEVRCSPAEAALIAGVSKEARSVSWLAVSRKVLAGFVITAIAIASYSLYCLRYY